MARIRDPLPFAAHFGIDPDALAHLGVLDPVLNVDTKLFIDPVLLSSSKTPEINQGGERRFHEHFQNVVRLLVADNGRKSVGWRAAAAMLRFPEVKWTCLGYGAASIRGSAFGRVLSGRMIETATEIIALGVQDPDLFKLIPLLEEGIGPDLISDLTTNIILPDLATVTARIAAELGIPTAAFDLPGGRFSLPINPTEARRSPVVLVPTDILRDLPIASDWSEVADVAAHNSALRRRINQHIGDIWSRKSRADKAKLRSAVLRSRESFEALLNTIRDAKVSAYDIQSDPEGLLSWRVVRERVASDFPLDLTVPSPLSKANAIAIVDRIVQKFAELIESQGLWKVLWYNEQPHKEKVAQMIFFAVADAYCKANNLPMTPEAETGSGPVDFKFGAAYDQSILVEIKLSRNSSLVVGYTEQLDAYRSGTAALDATYLVIDVGQLGRKYQALLRIRNERAAAGGPVSKLVLVDGKRRPSASKRRS